MKSLRPDLATISQWIEPGSQVLDLGCGDGQLLAHLNRHRNVTGYGLEIDIDKIVRGIESGVPIVHADLDAGLSQFADNSFDYVILTHTLQAIMRPDRLLQEMLRVGREGIVTFPNFGHWSARLQLGFKGKMPMSRTLPNDWFSTPNIHLCTVVDFEQLCTRLGIRVFRREMLDQRLRSRVLMNLFPNLLAEIALYRITRS